MDADQVDPSPREIKPKRRPLGAEWIRALFFLLAFLYTFVHQDYSGGTSISRLDLLHAVWDEGRVEIDTFAHNTSDKALFKGHYYSDKAPGVAMLALLPFALARWLGLESDSEAAISGQWLAGSWVATACSAGLLTAAGGVFLCAWLRRWVGLRIAVITTLAIFVGSLPFPYATVLFSHGLVAGLIAAALCLIQRGDQPVFLGRTRVNSAGLAGFCCGLALASEFTAGLVLGGVGVLAAVTLGRQFKMFLLGAVPPLLMIPIYSWACFGTPFTLGYSHQATFPEMKHGLFGILWPSPEIALKLLFSPDRGLFFWSPFLVIAVIGFPILFRRSRLLFWLCLLIPILQVAIISGNRWDWRAGWTLGPRYLAPILPFLALPCALGVSRLPRLGLFLAAVSILLTGLGTVVDATPRYEIHNPLLELHIPKLLSGKPTHNLGQGVGLSGHQSLVLLVVLIVFYGALLWRALRIVEERDERAAVPVRGEP